MIRIVFFGTPIFAEEIFRFLLLKQVPILGVVTQPDRPMGRSSEIIPSPVKKAAFELVPEIPVFQPLKASEEKFLEDLSALKADLFVVVAYGRILPQKLLDIPPLGCINIHASLLPKYRGAAPIQRAIMSGDKETGVSIQKMVKELDAGDVIREEKISIGEEMTAGELQKKLCEIAKEPLIDVLKQYEKGVPEGQLQDPSKISFAAKLEPEEGEISWNNPAQKIHDHVRAFSPKPGAWCWVFLGEEKKRLKIFRTKVLEIPGVPGEISQKSPIVGCTENSIELVEIQLEGKKAMRGSDWYRGLQKPLSLKI